ncbi:MAG: nucleotidyltransferase domain-containing protein [Methanospirillum sp.]|nr:nucleotidyltransferase domain-containing protein [Methanospirillum sp.]
MIPKDLDEKKEEIIRIAKKHGVLSVRLFGSFARGEETRGSDIDLLVTVGSWHSRWFPGGLVADLEELTGRNVDIVEEEVLSPDIKKKIIQESILL